VPGADWITGIGGSLYVSQETNVVSRIDVVDPAAMRVVSRTRAGSGPIVTLPAFGHVWVSNTLGSELLRL
jgi:hypothetical protein